MFFTSLETAGGHPEFPAAVNRALEYLRTHDCAALAPGDYPIEGEKMFAKVFDATSRKVEDTLPEIHKKYIDVQFWASGEELMGYAPNTGTCAVARADEGQDLYFLEKAENEVFIPARAGDVMVLFPGDIHRPAVQKTKELTYRKVVVKVSVDLL